MAERYTSQAKEAIRCAEMAAAELSQNYVGTEHLLLGLVQEGSGVAARILENNGITEEKILNLIDQLISLVGTFVKFSESHYPSVYADFLYPYLREYDLGTVIEGAEAEAKGPWGVR